MLSFKNDQPKVFTERFTQVKMGEGVNADCKTIFSSVKAKLLWRQRVNDKKLRVIGKKLVPNKHVRQSSVLQYLYAGNGRAPEAAG